MPTLHGYRLVVICPVGAKLNAVATWLRTNIDATIPADLGPGLNASGNLADPITYRWLSWAVTQQQARQILAQLCQLASITPPTLATWNGWTKAQRISWLVSVRSSIWTNYGVWVTLTDNEQALESPAVPLAAVGLKAAAAATP